jgi:Acetyltransferase (isoleucine patch superfamily)
MIGFKRVGINVKISRKVSIYNPEEITIGDHVRIDDFCILNGPIKIGSYIHISAYTALYGRGGIELEDFVTISSRVNVYSVNDDYSGEYLTNPMIPEQFTNVLSKPVIIKKYSIIGAGSIILPGVIIDEGVAVGALSLVKQSLDSWNIYGGIPCRFLNNRSKRLLNYVKKLKQ